MDFILNHLISGMCQQLGGVGFIKTGVGLISLFSLMCKPVLLNSNLIFERYIKTFEISVVFTVRNIKLHTLKSLLQN